MAEEPKRDTRFKPGQSGNPLGASIARRGVSMTHLLKELGELRDVRHDGELIARKEAIGHKLWSLALKGNEKAIRYLYDRIDGKPTQEIKVQSDVRMDAPVYVVVTGARIEYDDEQADDEHSGDDPETE